MNYRKVFSRLGSILQIEGLLLIIPTLIGVLFMNDSRYSDNWWTVCSFLITIASALILGTIFRKIKPKSSKFYAKEGCYLVALTWLFMSAFGAMPFVISGAIPNYMNAFFETVSGFTTTGSTILTEIESLPRSILFWRAFTHFIGGMGILVFVIAILPKTEGSSMHIMRAESPGPTVGKLVSKLRASARILYGIYCAMTFVLIALLMLGGMNWFDAATNAFATAGTGGFCVLNNSIEGYGSPYFEVVISIFMMLFGVNFNLYFLILVGQWRNAIKSEELRWYVGIIFISTIIIAFTLWFTEYPQFSTALRESFFQVTSIISTTGFSSTNFDLWPTVTKIILFLLMFIGSCAGSTGGGLKVTRVVVLIKSSFRSIRKTFSPRSVETIKSEGKPVDEETVRSITSYLAIYAGVVAISIFLVSIEGNGMLETITSVVTCINNVGPAFGSIGPAGNFSDFSYISKIVLSFDMLAGRLELIPMFMIFSKYAIPHRMKRTK